MTRDYYTCVSKPLATHLFNFPISRELLKKFNRLHEEASQGEHELQETNRKEQHLKRMIESKEGKHNKQALQHQNKMGDMQDTMERLNRSAYMK